MIDNQTDRSKFKKLFSNTTSRMLLGTWLLVKGSRFSMDAVAELLSIPEDSLEAKLQTFAGMGLVNVVSGPGGERQVEFLATASPDIEKTIWELFDGRKHDFDSVEMKLRSLLYKKLLTIRL